MKILNIKSVFHAKIGFAIFIYFLSIPMTLHAQKDLEVLRNWIEYSDQPNALYHHYAHEAYGYLNKREVEVSRIHTLQQWQERQRDIRKKLLELVGPFPIKAPLNAKITKTVDKPDYVLQNIIFESQPGYYVTSGLFIPKGLKGKAPAIIYCSGHSNTGYRSYQATLINLVKKGFIVFAFDPIGQGERLQYYDKAKDKSSFRWPAWEHSYVGAQMFLTGNNLARNFIWDGIRAVDYLITRPEVDPQRIGINGRSGGGTQSAYIAAFDARIKAAAPENYITSFKKLYQSIGPQDAEQDFLYGIKNGIDMADLLEVRAPKPTLIITTTQDMFPIQGARDTYEEARKVYRSYGKTANINMVSDDAPHASTKKNREAMYAFFQEALGNPGDPADMAVDLLTADELKVTTTGQVVTALNSETAFSLNLKDAELKLKKLNQDRSGRDYPKNILAEAKRISGFQLPTSLHQPSFMGRFQREGYAIEKYILKGSGDYVIPYIIMVPAQPSDKGILYLNPAGKFADTTKGGMMEWLVRQGYNVIAPDLLGAGESGPGVFKGDSYIDSVSYNVWFATVLTGGSIPGLLASDLIRVKDAVKLNNGIKKVLGYAVGQLSPVLLHAAAFDTSISKVALYAPYSSYRSMVVNPRFESHFLQSTVPASIGKYDLPDLAASLAPRSLLIANMTDGDGKTNWQDTEKDIQVIENVFRKNAPSQLQIIKDAQTEDLRSAMKNWLQ